MTIPKHGLFFDAIAPNSIHPRHVICHHPRHVPKPNNPAPFKDVLGISLPPYTFLSTIYGQSTTPREALTSEMGPPSPSCPIPVKQRSSAAEPGALPEAAPGYIHTTYTIFTSIQQHTTVKALSDRSGFYAMYEVLNSATDSRDKGEEAPDKANVHRIMASVTRNPQETGGLTRHRKACEHGQ